MDGVQDGKLGRLTIGQRVDKVRGAIGYIPKTEKVDKKYPVATHDVVTAMLRPEMTKHGIIMTGEMISGEWIKTDKVSKTGTPAMFFYAVFRIDFCASDKPDEKVSWTVPGAGEDYGDKSTGKALSLAVKNAMLKMFNLETGENEESRIQGRARAAEPTLETKEAFDSASETAQALGKDITVASNGWIKWYKLDSLDDMTDQQMKDTTASLNAWIEKNEPKGNDLNDNNT